MADYDEVEKTDKRRLWEHLLTVVHGTSDLSREKDPKKVETETFFVALDIAFTSSGKMNGLVPVDRELVQYLAGWGRDTTRYNLVQGGNPLDPANHFAFRAFDGFIQTLRHAIKLNLVWSRNGKTHFGCLELPQWIVEKYMNEARRQAEHMNQMYDEHPSFRQHASAV